MYSDKALRRIAVAFRATYAGAFEVLADGIQIQMLNVIVGKIPGRKEDTFYAQHFERIIRLEMLGRSQHFMRLAYEGDTEPLPTFCFMKGLAFANVSRVIICIIFPAESPQAAREYVRIALETLKDKWDVD